jgi:hypothetical protein
MILSALLVLFKDLMDITRQTDRWIVLETQTLPGGTGLSFLLSTGSALENSVYRLKAIDYNPIR